MKKPQWITVGVALTLTLLIYFFAHTTPPRKAATASEAHSDDDGHDHGPAALTIDSILAVGRKQLNTEQVAYISLLENSLSRGDVKNQQMKVFHELSHFWGDSIGFFPAYAWYESEAARLENSEKTLTFAARLFLQNLQREPNPALRKWEALQAKDLLERSLTVNPDNDSARVELGAVYLFGNVSDAPMEGIAEIRKVLEKDSTNTYALLTLAKGALLSNQTDKAVERLETVYRLDPANVEAVFMLADLNDKLEKKEEAIRWYKECLKLIDRADIRNDIQARIETLSK